MIVDQDVYCDCPEGDKAMNKDSRTELYGDYRLEPIEIECAEEDYYFDAC
jgi:hypothetical protein